MKKKLLLYVSCIWFSCVTFKSIAQNPNENQNECGTDIVHKIMMQTDSIYKNNFLDIDLFCLATRSPLGLATTGIKRVDGSGVAGFYN